MQKIQTFYFWRNSKCFISQTADENKSQQKIEKICLALFYGTFKFCMYMYMILQILTGASKKRKTHRLEPIATAGTSKGAASNSKKLGNHKKDRQQFRNALVDIITYVFSENPKK